MVHASCFVNQFKTVVDINQSIYSIKRKLEQYFAQNRYNINWIVSFHFIYCKQCCNKTGNRRKVFTSWGQAIMIPYDHTATKKYENEHINVTWIGFVLLIIIICMLELCSSLSSKRGGLAPELSSTIRNGIGVCSRFRIFFLHLISSSAI